jgi:hypothetical protein
MLKGKLQVTMRFEVPVSEDMYPEIKKTNTRLRQGMSERQILRAEEENYINDPDNYLDVLGDHIASVSFDFVRSQERWDES